MEMANIKRLKTWSRCRGCNNKVASELEGINTNNLGDYEHNQEKMNTNKPKENKHEQSKGKQTWLDQEEMNMIKFIIVTSSQKLGI